MNKLKNKKIYIVLSKYKHLIILIEIDSFNFTDKMNYHKSNNHSLSPQISSIYILKSLEVDNISFLYVSHLLVFPCINELLIYKPNFSPHPIANPSDSQKIK